MSTNLPNRGTGSARQVSNDPQPALYARPDNEPAPPALPAPRLTSAPRTGEPADRPTFSPRTGQTADRPSAPHTGQEDEIARRGTDVDAAVGVAEGARTEEGFWHTVRHPHRR